MMNNTDIRWIQRFNHYKKALQKLSTAVTLSNQRKLSELEQQGVIQAFEFTHELAWKTMKDFLNYQGVAELFGSKDTTREAFKQELVCDGEIWMDMIKSRNLTSHTYNEEIASEIFQKIIENYHCEFLTFQDKMTGFSEKEV
jgi:nucleotidyltransferase substrate binding protein (TIGR01987 family)